MHRRLVKPTFAAAVAIGVLAAAPAGAQTKVKMYLDWLVNGYHAAFFVGVDKGWYKEAGLDVTVEPGKGSFDAVRAVAAGAAEFGFPDAATASKAIADGMKLKMVAVFLQDTPMGLVSFADKNIKTPKDLAGKKMSNVPIASTAKVLPAFLKKNGVDITKLSLVNHTFATAVPSVLNGDVDVGQGYIFGEYLAIKNGGKGRAVNWMAFSQYGIAMYSNGIAVNTDFLAKNPKAVGAFVKASIKSLQWTIGNVDAAIAIVAKKTETAAATLKEQLTVAIPLMNNADAKKNGLGSMTKARWDATQAIMVEYGEQKKTLPDAELWTGEFLK